MLLLLVLLHSYSVQAVYFSAFLHFLEKRSLLQQAMNRSPMRRDLLQLRIRKHIPCYLRNLHAYQWITETLLLTLKTILFLQPQQR